MLFRTSQRKMSASLTQLLFLLSVFMPLFLCQDTCSSDAITNCTFDRGHFCEWEHENWYIQTSQAYLYSTSSRGSIKSRWACPNFEGDHCLRISYYVEHITDTFEIVYKQENRPTSKVDLPIGHFGSGRRLISIPRSTLRYQISIEATRFTTLIPGQIRIDSIQYDKHACTTHPTGVATTEAIPPHSIQTETPLAQPLLTTSPTEKLTSALSQTAHTSKRQLSTETTQSTRTSSVESQPPFHPEIASSHASEISLTVQSTTTDTSTPRNKTSRDHENLQTLSSLEGGLIAGITVLIIVTVVTIVGAVFVIVLIRRRRKENGKPGSNEHNQNDETLHRKPVPCPESDDTQEENESAGSGVDTESDYETCPSADTKAVMRYEDDPTTQSSHTETAVESKAEKDTNVDDGYERARPHPPSYISIQE